MATGRRLPGVRASASAPTSGWLRVARGAVVGATAMGLSVGGHILAGGALPAPATAAALLGRHGGGQHRPERPALDGLPRWCPCCSVSRSSATWRWPAIRRGHLANHRHAAHGVSASMVAAHVLAALVTAVLLSRGESWCWRLVALLSRPVHVAALLTARTPQAFGAPSPAPAVGSLPVLRSLLLGDAQPRRGPPALLAA